MTYAGALIDLDGTVYRGDELLPGVADAVAALRERMDVLFLSNKAIERRADYAAKLSEMGMATTEREVLNSATITADYLVREFPNGEALVVGERPLVAELEAAGVGVTDSPDDADVVVASMDREFDYETLTQALHAFDRGGGRSGNEDGERDESGGEGGNASGGRNPNEDTDENGDDETAFVATNPDRTCPVEGGEIPDAAGMIGAIEGVTGRGLDRVLGKPSETAVTAATNVLGAAVDECLMVGDRLETDILMGERAGMTTVLVLSGVTDEADLEAAAIEPDHIVDSLADIESVL